MKLLINKIKVILLFLPRLHICIYVFNFIFSSYHTIWSHILSVFCFAVAFSLSIYSDGECLFILSFFSYQLILSFFLSFFLSFSFFLMNEYFNFLACFSSFLFYSFFSLILTIILVSSFHFFPFAFFFFLFPRDWLLFSLQINERIFS